MGNISLEHYAKLADSQSVEVNREQARKALNISLRDSLPSVLLAFGTLFVVFTISHLFLLTGSARWIMAPLAGITALLCFGVAAVLRQRELPAEWAHPLATGVAEIVLLNTLMHLYVTRDPLQTTNVLLLIIGAGFIMFSTAWWLAVVGTAFLGWGLVVLAIGSDPAWGHFGFALISAMTVSLVVHMIRARTYRRLEKLRLQDEQRQVKLELALRATEQVQTALEMTVDVAQRITSILDLDTLLNQVAELIKERYGYYFVGIFLLDESGDYVVARAGTGDAGRLLREQNFRLAVGKEGIIGWVASTREPACVNNVTQDEHYVSVDAVANTRSELALPLEVAEDLLGVLDIQSDKLWAFNADDVQILQSLAGQVAIAIQNALMYHVERKRRRFAERLHEVGRALSRTQSLTSVLDIILMQLADIVPYDRGSIMLEDNKEMIVKAARGFPEAARPLDLRVPISEDDVFSTMRKSQRPLLVPEVQQRPDWQYVEHLPPARSWLGVPLILEDQVIGMLSLTRERPDPYTDDEVTLSAAFASQAAIALENARLYDNITNVNEALEATVQQLKERTEDLRITYAQLERLDRTKSDFISVASHELRTPLTVLSGYSQILLDEAEIKQRDYHHQLVAGIKSGTERMHTIVDSMLDMAKIDSRVMQLHPEPVIIGSLIDAIRATLEAKYMTRDLTIALEDLDDLPVIEADTEALRKVFYHLLVNAIKYTPDGGHITVSGRKLGPDNELFPSKGIEVVVSDTGIGIDPNVHELIFAKFYQTGEVAVHSSGTTKFKGGGPGLGLAIARGIIEAHGGKIWVESPGYDEEACPGSQFYVILPLKTRSILDGSSVPDISS